MFLGKIKYCSQCGAEVVFKLLETEDKERVYCESCQTIHYTNPKMVVGALVYWEDKILLCRRAIEPRYGLWNLPAGYLEDHERAEEGAQREVWEEAGAKVEIEGVLAVYNIPRANQVYIHYFGQLVNGEFTNGVESLETGLFSESEIPLDKMAFTSSTFAIRHYFEDIKSGNIRTHMGTFPEV